MKATCRQPSEVKRDMGTRPLGIALFGNFGTLNLGNECTIQAVIANIQKRLPHCQISCICTNPEDTAKRHKISASLMSYREASKESRRTTGRWHILIRPVRILLLHIPKEALFLIKAMRAFRSIDIFIVPGTGFLTDAYTGAFGWPYELFKWSLVAKLSKSKLIFLGVGAGPIYRRLSGWLIKSALCLADFRSYRDQATQECLREIGFYRGGDRVCPDLAFDLPEGVLPSGHRRQGDRQVVAIGLMSYAGELRGKPNATLYRNYLVQLSYFVRWLLDRNYTVRLVIGDMEYDKYVRQHLKECLFDHSRGRYDETQIIDEPIVTVGDVLSQLSDADLVVATRFHNVALALILLKPVICISFHSKCTSLMSGMGLQRYCQEFEELDGNRLKEQFVDLEREAEVIGKTIKQKTETFRSELEEQYRLILDEGVGAKAYPCGKC